MADPYESKWVNEIPFSRDDGLFEVREVRRDSRTWKEETVRVLAVCTTWESGRAAARLLSDFAPIGK